MSINKFVFDVQTGKLAKAETFDYQGIITSKRITKTWIDWGAIWRQPIAVSALTIFSITAVRALLANDWAAFGFAFTLLAVIGGFIWKCITDDKPSIYVKFKVAPEPVGLGFFQNLKGSTCIAATSEKNIQGLIALSPTQDTITIYLARRYSLDVDMYIIYKELFGQDIGYEQPTVPFTAKQAYHLPRAIIDKMKTAQAGFETLPVRLPIEIYDSAMLFRCGFKTMPLNPDIVDWLESIVAVFQSPSKP